MKGLTFLGDRRLGFIDVDDPSPGPGEVVLEMRASGLCGSDLHTYRAPHDSNVSKQSRMIGGHEPCGVVVAVGPGVPVHAARAGDRMMVHHYHGCTMCTHCRTGWPQLCDPSTRIVYSVHAHGAHAPYMKVPATTLIPLHESLSWGAGAAIACGTGTAWGALERLGVCGGETVAVFGQGPVGLSATLLAAARGSRVIAIDIDDQRLALAKSFGADITLNAAKLDTSAEIQELTAGRGVPMAVETSGSTQAATSALRAAGVWGKVCFVGLGATVAFDVRTFLDRQLNLMTSYSMSSVGQMACADFVVERRLDLDRLFTHRWRLDQAEEAYALFDQQSSGKGVFLF